MPTSNTPTWAVPATSTHDNSPSSNGRGAVIGGAGLSALSRLTVAADLASGSLVEVGIVGLDLERSLRAVWRQGRLSQAGRAVVELARAG